MVGKSKKRGAKKSLFDFQKEVRDTQEKAWQAIYASYYLGQWIVKYDEGSYDEWREEFTGRGCFFGYINNISKDEIEISLPMTGYVDIDKVKEHEGICKVSKKTAQFEIMTFAFVRHLWGKRELYHLMDLAVETFSFSRVKVIIPQKWCRDGVDCQDERIGHLINFFHPDCMCAPVNIEWSLENHKYRQPDVRKAIWTIMLVNQRKVNNAEFFLPKDIMLNIFRITAKNWNK